jgi:anthranilate 1,2-dioxygenase large subunit
VQTHCVSWVYSPVCKLELEALLRKRERPLPRQFAAYVSHDFQYLSCWYESAAIPDPTYGMHSIITATKIDDSDTADAYKKQAIRSMDEGFTLEDDSVLGFIHEFEEPCTNHIQALFPQLVLQQIHNSLVARQILPKGPNKFELVFHFFGYEDDTPELRALRIKQANLVGPAGYISMEDTEATELVQRATLRDPDESTVLELGRNDPTKTDTMLSENMLRRFWVGYQKMMGY